jgi:hypothetical protein
MSFVEHSDIVQIGSSLTDLLTAEAGTTLTITSLRIGHVDSSGSTATVSLALAKGGGVDTYFQTAMQVQVGESVVICSKLAGELVLQSDSGSAADTLSAVASTADTLVALISWIEHTT